MKINNVFADLIKNGKKTIEIRKENSFDKIWKKYVSFGHTTYKNGNISDDIYYNGTNGLLKELMYVEDLPNCNCYPELVQCQCIDRTFWIVFEGYQRIKVSELKELIDISNDEDLSWMELMDTKASCWYQFMNNWHWIKDNQEFIEEYLKDEEYCILYFINYEETKKVNGW